MTRIEFLAELSRKLDKLPKEEFENVLRYYDEVFLDAGVDKESETAENLGSIDEIARQILIDNNIAPDGEPEFFVQKPDGKEQNNQKYNNSQTQNNSDYSNNNTFNNQNYAYKKKSDLGWKIAVIILTFPIWLPIIIILAALAFAAVVTAISLIFALVVTAIACVIGGIVTLFTEPFLGMFVLGIGLVAVGICSLAGVPFFKWAFSLIKKLFDKLTSWGNRLMKKWGVR